MGTSLVVVVGGVFDSRGVRERVRLDDRPHRGGRLRSPPVWAVLNSRSARPRPTIERSQRSIVENRSPKPVRKPRCTKNHTSQPGKPLSRTLADAGDGPEAADRRHAAEVAVAERAAPARPSRRRTIVLAAWRPPCIATSATPGRLSSDGHVADREDLGMAGQREVGEHRDATGPIERRRRWPRPARPRAARPATPAAQTVGVGRRCASRTAARRRGRRRPRSTSTPTTRGAHAQLDAEPRQLPGRPPPRAGRRTVASGSLPPSTQHHPDRRRVEACGTRPAGTASPARGSGRPARRRSGRRRRRRW